MGYFIEIVVNRRLSCKFEEDADQQREEDNHTDKQYIMPSFRHINFTFDPFNDLHGRKCHEYQHNDAENKGEYKIDHGLTP